MLLKKRNYIYLCINGKNLSCGVCNSRYSTVMHKTKHCCIHRNQSQDITTWNSVEFNYRFVLFGIAIDNFMHDTHACAYRQFGQTHSWHSHRTCERQATTQVWLTTISCMCIVHTIIMLITMHNYSVILILMRICVHQQIGVIDRMFLMRISS